MKINFRDLTIPALLSLATSVYAELVTITSRKGRARCSGVLLAIAGEIEGRTL